MDGHKGLSLPGLISCSVCFEAVNDASERSTAKLTCGHQFHLDCIGSAFNAKGSMQCPNCRHTEHGQWLYANCVGQRAEPFFEEPTIDGVYGLYAEVPESLVSDEHVAGHIQRRPYQQSYSSSPLEVGLGDNQRSYLVIDVLVCENLESGEILPILHPVSLAQMPASVAHVSDAQENVRVQESSALPQRGAWYQREHPSSRGHWGSQQPAALAPISLGLGVGFTQDSGSRWPQLENRSTLDTALSQGMYYMRRPPITSARSAGNHLGSQFSLSGPHYSGRSTSPNPNREPDLRNSAPFTQRRHGGISAFQQYPIERERQRWALPPLSGLYGANGNYGSELPTQSRFVAPLQSQIQAGFQAFPHYLGVEVELEPSV